MIVINVLFNIGMEVCGGIMDKETYKVSKGMGLLKKMCITDKYESHTESLKTLSDKPKTFERNLKG